MKKIVTVKDFSEYFNKTDSLVAAEISNQVVEEFLKRVVKDPTNGATGEFAEGYRACIGDLLRELE